MGFVSGRACRAVLTLAGAAAAAGGSAASAQQDLAKQLANPIASLISVPIQSNYDAGFGSEDGWRVTTNIQPVVPISVNEDWNLISRTILPVIVQDDVAGASGHQVGLGDVVQSAFFSPKAPTAGGLVWGVGPVFLLPTATDDRLGGGKVGIGPTAVALVQRGPWTVGALGNHIWSVAGDGGRAAVNATYLQPFLSYTTPSAWTFGLSSEATYAWGDSELSIPLNATIGKIVMLGGQAAQITGGVRYWVESPSTGPEGLGARLQLTLLFPK